MPEALSAGGLLDSLKKSFGFRRRQEAPVEAAPEAAPESISVETPLTDTLGSNGAVMEAAQVEVPAPKAAMVSPVPAPDFRGEPQDLSEGDVRAMYGQAAAVPPAEAPASAAAELPDWLQAGQGEAPPPVPEVPSPPQAEALVPAPEPPAEPKTEKKSTEELLTESLSILKAAFGAIGENRLTPEAKRQALMAAAKSNHLIAELPPAIQQIIYTSRAVAAQDPNYDRLAFQRDMLMAIKAIKDATVVEGEGQ